MIENRAPHVFILDDDEAVLNSLQFALGLEGFGVRTFRSTSEFLTLQTVPQNSCLVVDFRLPDRDGLAVIESLRRRGIRVPAILITTNPTRTTRRLAAEASISIVEKPAIDTPLVDAIRWAISRAAEASN